VASELGAGGAAHLCSYCWRCPPLQLLLTLPTFAAIVDQQSHHEL